VKRFADDVAPVKPDLVIWQLGANDIVRNVDPETVSHGVAEGMAQLETIGAPVVLMDSQVAPAVSASPVLQPVQSVLKAAAERHGAMLWSRFALMQGILEARLAEDTDLIKPDRLHMTVPMHVCTGEVLAEAIAAHLVPATPALATLPQPARSTAARHDLARNEH
jgi:lysophospholipase L1-like esterase